MALDIVSTAALLRALSRIAYVPPKGQKLLQILAKRDRPTAFAEIIDQMWGDDPDGGPLYAHELVQRYAFELRRAGYPVRNQYAYGYALGS